MIRWIHDAVIEDLLDRADTAVGHAPAQPAAWSPWVRLLRRLNGMPARRAVVRTAEVTVAMTAAAGLPDADFHDAFAVRLPQGGSPDVRGCYAALVSASTPHWMSVLGRIRRVLARAMRLDTADWQPGTSPFGLLHATDGLVVVGADDRHLNFRAVLELQAGPGTGTELVLATFVQRHNLAGRAYFALVRPFHRFIVATMLRRVAEGNALPSFRDPPEEQYRPCPVEPEP